MWKKVILAVLSLFRSDPSVQPLTAQEILSAHEGLYGGHEEMLLNPNDAGIKFTRFRWPGYPGGATVPYTIHPNLKNIENKINSAIDQYHKNTCIRFVKRTNEKDYVNIVKKTGCWSWVGKQGNRQELSLDTGCEPVGTIVHELGHAIGLYHEHQRSDRKSHLTVYMNNVKAGMEGNFNLTDPSTEIIFGKYDYTSIMHYGNYAFSKSPGVLKTMEATDGTPLKEPYERPGLNSDDISMIQQLYKC